MHSRCTWIRWRKIIINKRKKSPKLHSQQTGPWIILESAPQNTILWLFTKTKWQTFQGIPGFYLTSGAVDYTAVIFYAHLVTVKCKVFTTSTRGIQLCALPATQLMCSPLLPADFTRQSIAHARKFQLNGSMVRSVCSPNILRTVRRTVIRFLIELLVRRTWFGMFDELYFVLNWLIMRCKLRPQLAHAEDAQQTAWPKMYAKVSHYVKSVDFNQVAFRTAALRIICLMLLIRIAAQPLCRAADNQSQYLIYITWSLAAISNYEPVVRWRLGRPSTAGANLRSERSLF